MERLAITVGERPKPSILDILKCLRPDWNRDDLIIKELVGGQLNQTYYCGLNNDREEHDIVLVKVYGADTGDWLDRESEATSWLIAQNAGVASPLYCRFQNGLAYKYFKGNMVNSKNITDETCVRSVARTLAALHHLEPNTAMAGIGGSAYLNTVPFVMTLIGMVKKVSISSAFKDSYDYPLKEKVRLMECPSQADTMRQMEMYGKELEEMGFPTCFCHSDPNTSNIIYDPDTGEIHLVDWEFSGLDYAVHDIGWYFAGRLFVDDCADDGFRFYPDKEYQFKWIRWYLEYLADLRGEAHETITEADINKLHKGSILCALMRSIAVAFYFRMLDSVTPSKPEYFRKARHFQRLVRLIKDEHRADK